MNIILNHLEKHYLYYLILLFSLPFYIGWFTDGIIIGADFQYRPSSYLQTFLNYGTWDPYLNGGYYTVEQAGLSKYVFFYLSGLLSLFFEYEVIQRIIWIFPLFFLGSFFIYSFLKYLYKNPYFIFFGSLFYIANPIILERIHRAHVWMPMVYFLIPFIFLIFIRFLDTKKSNSVMQSLIMGAIIGIFFWIEVRTALLSTFLLFFYYLYFFFKTKKESLSLFMRTSVLIGLGIIVINLFWILPLIMTPPSSLYDESIMNPQWLFNSGQSTGNFLNVIQFFPKNWSDFYSYASLIIPISILVYLFINIFKNKYIKNTIRINKILPFVFLSLPIILFLGKGTTAPLGELYLWLDLNIPLFVGYRVSNKFLLVGAVLYAILYGLSISLVIKLIKNKLTKYFFILISLTSLYAGGLFVFHGYIDSFSPVQKYGNEGNMFLPKKDGFKKTEELVNHVKSKNNYTRTLWFPKVNRFRFGEKNNFHIFSSLSNTKKTAFSHIFALDTGIFINNQYKNASFFLSLIGVDSIILNSIDTSDWAYTKRHNYGNILEILLQDKSFKMVNTPKETPIQIKETIKEQIDKNIYIFNKINLSEVPKNTLLKIKLSSSLSETINIVVEESTINKAEKSVKLNSKSEQIIIIDISGLKSLKSIDIYNSLPENKIKINSVSLIEGESILFLIKNKHFKIFNILNIADVFYKNIKINNNKVEEVLNINNFIEYRFNKNIIPLSDYYLYFQINPSIEENINIEVSNDNNILHFSYKIRKNKPVIIPMKSSFGKIRSIKLSNIYFNNLLEIESMKLIISQEEHLIELNKIFSTSNLIEVNSMDLLFNQCPYLEFQNSYINKIAITQPKDQEFIKINCVKYLKKFNTKNNANKSFFITEDKNSNKTLKSSNIIDSPYIIVFNETFNNHWVLKSKKYPNHVYDHFSVNANKNAWRIDKDDNEFYMEFLPQKYFIIGKNISIVFSIFILIFLVFSKIRKNQKNPSQKNWKKPTTSLTQDRY